MDLRKLPVFSMMAKRMTWLAERQKVLAQNIANADTPEYRPHDLAPLSFRDMARTRAAGGVTPSVTHAAHISPARPAETPARARPQKDALETTPSGNAVVLEEQLMKVAETAMDYETTTNLYRKHISMIKDAIGRNG